MGKRTEEVKKRDERVMATGTFDLIHPGHIFYLSKAKSLGNQLVVVVARDSTPKIKPIIPEKQRKKVINSLKPVDKAILGDKKDKLKPVESLTPDKIVLGPDQDWNESEVKNKIKKELGLNIEVIKIKEYKKCQLCSTTEIIKKIKKNC